MVLPSATQRLGRTKASSVLPVRAGRPPPPPPRDIAPNNKSGGAGGSSLVFPWRSYGLLVQICLTELVFSMRTAASDARLVLQRSWFRRSRAPTVSSPAEESRRRHPFSSNSKRCAVGLGPISGRARAPRSTSGKVAPESVQSGAGGPVGQGPLGAPARLYLDRKIVGFVFRASCFCTSGRTTSCERGSIRKKRIVRQALVRVLGAARQCVWL